MTDQGPLSDFVASLNTCFEQFDHEVGHKETERQNVERIRQLYLSLASGDFEAFGACLSPEVWCEIRGAPEIPFSRNAEGPDGVKALVQHNFSRLERQSPQLISVVAQGDMVVVRGQETGRLAGASKDYQLHWVQEYSLDQGLVSRIVQFMDSAE